MSDANRNDGASPTSPRVGTRPRRLGCLAWIVGLVVFGVVFFGVGQPHTFWHHIDTIQVFETERGVVAFVEVALATHRPGLLRSPPVIHTPVSLYRIDVGSDGAVKKVLLSFPAGQRHILYIEEVLKVPQGLFLVQTPSRGRPSYQLHRIEGDRVEPLSFKDSEVILQSSGYAERGERTAEVITERNGWRLLERLRSLTFTGLAIVSPRHQLRLRFDGHEKEQRLSAEPLGEGDRWTASILAVETERRNSYQVPRE